MQPSLILSATIRAVTASEAQLYTFTCFKRVTTLRVGLARAVHVIKSCEISSLSTGILTFPKSYTLSVNIMISVQATHLAGRSVRLPHSLGQQRNVFFQGATVSQRPSYHRTRQNHRIEILNFKFLKDLGLKKPAFLPDFGLEKRKAVLDKLHTSFDAATLDQLLADDLKIIESGKLTPFSKKEWITFVTQHIKPAIPDFSWGHLTTGEKDDDGFSIVKLEAVGHHTGKPFTLPGNASKYPPVEPSGNRFRLAEQTVKFKVEDGQVREIQVRTADAHQTIASPGMGKLDSMLLS